MCGIAGIVDYRQGASGHLHDLRRMREALAHRGPDGRGKLCEGPLALAHARLAIVDPTPGADQPMVSADGRYVLAYNGQLHDEGALRGRLSDIAMRTDSDTEVVLEWLVRHGTAGLADLRGMFALCFWDRQREAGFLARDRLGVKPLVVHRAAGGALLFASEVKALIAALPGRPSLDPAGFVEWVVAPSLAGGVSTPLAGVEVLPAGGLIQLSRDGFRPSRWCSPWRPASGPAAPLNRQGRPDALQEPLAQALLQAVRRTAAAPEPVGVFLSGGLDSSAIAAAAVDGTLVRAWTVRFQDQATFDYAGSRIVLSDDSPFAALAAERLHLTHAWVDVDRAATLDDIRAVARADDRLPAWEQQVAQHHLARAAARDGVRVVLVGDAADETHHGYHFLLDDAVAASPTGIIERLGARRRAALLAPHLRRGQDVVAALGRRYEHEAAAEGLHWRTLRAGRVATGHLIVSRWLTRLLHNGDIHTMAHGVEARVPFADPDLLALAARVPVEAAFVRGVGKQVLRRAAPAALPAELRWRRKSALPKDQAADPIYRDGARSLLADRRELLAGWLDEATISSLIAKPKPLDEVERAMLFATLAFAAWSEHWLGV